jgi:hypothetical protein
LRKTSIDPIEVHPPDAVTVAAKMVDVAFDEPNLFSDA